MKRILLTALAAMLLVPAIALAAFTPGNYTGKTSRATKFRPVSFTVTASKLKNLKITVAFTCTDGDTSLSKVVLSGFPSQNVVNGRYSATFRGSSGGSKYVNKGSISGKTATGTFSGTRTYNAQGKIDPRGTITCRTGNLPYTAKTK
jgi:hypothetical protein